LFAELPPFESEGRTVRQGLATADDFRFVRAWWEVAPERILDGANGPDWREELVAFQAWCRQRTFEGKRWVPFAKGGAYSPYYADLHLVVDWERDGEEIRGFVDPLTRRPYSRPQNTDFYFRPGLTWPLRARRFAPQSLPAGSICSVRGYGIFCESSALSALVALGNSALFDYLYKVLLGRFGFPEFIVGVLQQLPVPRGLLQRSPELSHLAHPAITQKRGLDCANETSHVFCLPAVLLVPGDKLAERIATWQAQVAEAGPRLAEYQREIDDIAFSLYGIDG